MRGPIVAVVIHRHMYETDFGWRESWSCPSSGAACDTKQDALYAARRLAAILAADGIGYRVKYTQGKTYMPEGW